MPGWRIGLKADIAFERIRRIGVKPHIRGGRLGADEKTAPPPEMLVHHLKEPPRSRVRTRKIVLRIENTDKARITRTRKERACRDRKPTLNLSGLCGRGANSEDLFEALKERNGDVQNPSI